MKIIPVLIIILVAAIAVIVAIGVTGGFEPGSTPTSTAEPTPTPASTPTATLTPLPTVVMGCVEARDTIQDALESYNTEYGNWPTMDGEPGEIEWTKLVPNFMEAVPANDSKCDWWVNSDPEGEVCVQNTC